MSSLLAVRDLHVNFTTPDGMVRAVAGINFEVRAGQTLGIVGESGSGKSQTVLALMGLLAANGCASGSAVFAGEEILGLPDARMNRIRGVRMSMIFQDPMTSLNPYLKIGSQMSQVLRLHEGLSRSDALHRCREMLDAVHISDAARRLKMYPHELSGGMRQRVMIATALLCRPSLLIADEPTTALDVTVQAQILALMRELRSNFDTAILLITHDLGVVAGLCDHVLVMQKGEVREFGTTDEIFYRTSDDYTRSLLAAVPRLDQSSEVSPVAAESAEPVLSVDKLKVMFKIPAEKWLKPDRTLRAVDGVSLTLGRGETLGVVGESGCGKSTLARAVLRLVEPTEGKVCLLGQNLGELDSGRLKNTRRDMQIIFQDPLASLNPRMTVRDIVAEPLRTFRRDLSAEQITGQVAEILRLTGLERAHLNRYPHQFSGGQCQRIGIARALILKPRVIICDEPVSALDVSVQGQIIRLLIELQSEFELSLIFIAHDLAVVRRISHRVMVMYLGRVVELATQDELYENPRHPYTRALLDAVPVPDPAVERAKQHVPLEGDVPSPLAPPSGCSFRTRCAFATELCARERPVLKQLGGSQVACHHAEKI
jgi:oligopeptide/dipeptide ABC transporter ATP-binding protein